MKLKKELKPAIGLFAIILGVFVFAIVYITSGKNFNTTHNLAIPQTVGADGRYVAGAPESYTLEISTSMAWKHGHGKTFRVIAIFLLAAAGIFIFLVAIDKVMLKGAGSNVILYGLMLAAAACMFAAYSSGAANNKVTITPQEYEQVKDDEEKIEQLFLDKGLLR